MRNLKLVLVLIISLILTQCEKEDSFPDEYLTATVNGKDYRAKWLKTKKYTDDDGRKWLKITSATIDLEQSHLNSDYESISFSLIDGCLTSGTYNYEFILSESGMTDLLIPFLYYYTYYNLDEDRSYGYSGTNINVVVDQIEYLENGIVKGEFEFEAISITDTVKVKNGKFQLRIEE